jgi:RNA polymerase sigma factor (sigma-70 family)
VKSDETSDAAIVAASLGDPELFATLFDRHYQALHGYLLRRVQAAVASEICSEAFLIAFERRQQFQGANASARPWIFGIALNLLRRHYRRERRELAAYARTGCDPLQDESSNADERLSQGELAKQLAGALANLADKDREALLLYAWADLSYPEIAEAMNSPIGTVKSRIARARRALRSSAPETVAGYAANEGATL